MAEIYAPKGKVAIASSFEGVFNNGAPECALVSINAYDQMYPDKAFYDISLSAKEFEDHKNDFVVQGFLALRPLVTVAEDYHTVLELIQERPDYVKQLLAYPEDQNAAEILTDGFLTTVGNTEERTKFGKGKESFFYKAREALKAADVFAWMNTQEPYALTLRELRKLAETQKYGTISHNALISGFVPYFATSKDEESTFLLCKAYTGSRKMTTSDIEGQHCIIPRGRIIGIETVPSKDKIETLKVIAEKEDLPHSHVWRVNDMVVNDEIEKLFDNGFRNIFVVTGGYVFPYQIDAVRKDKRVKVIEREGMAKELSGYAQAWGY